MSQTPGVWQTRVSCLFSVLFSVLVGLALWAGIALLIYVLVR